MMLIDNCPLETEKHNWITALLFFIVLEEIEYDFLGSQQMCV